MVNTGWNGPFYHIEYTGKYSTDHDIASNYTISSTGGKFFWGSIHVHLSGFLSFVLVWLGLQLNLRNSYPRRALHSTLAYRHDPSLHRRDTHSCIRSNEGAGPLVGRAAWFTFRMALFGVDFRAGNFNRRDANCREASLDHEAESEAWAENENDQGGGLWLR